MEALVNTRERLISEARTLFAERGFAGVSIALVAAQVGMTKQALLHYFGTKERLYGEVLRETALTFGAVEGAIDAKGDPANVLESYVIALIPKTAVETERLRLLMRELLDNPGRIGHVASWYLKPFLDDLVAKLMMVPGWAAASHSDALAALLQLLGAINYHVVSLPTMRAIFGEKAGAELEHAFAAQFARLIQQIMAADVPLLAKAATGQETRSGRGRCGDPPPCS